jgi:hypothetical protein
MLDAEAQQRAEDDAIREEDLKNMSGIPAELGLRAGEWVVVRSKAEILSTLDEGGCLDGLPFQPEMFEYCGRRFRVFKTAHKTCDTVTKTGGRRMRRAVHLEGVRCDGSAHGGCQADCLIFWKEAWLRRADDVANDAPPEALHRRMEEIVRARVVRGQDADGEPLWSCQTTQLVEATEPLAWWDIRQYWIDITRGNHTLRVVLSLLLAGAVRSLIKTGHAYRALIRVYNAIQKWGGGAPFSHVSGTVPKSEPTKVESLNLQPGERVVVKSLQEINATLHAGTNLNRGMTFDKEMAVFCDTEQEVKARIDRIIDERTGRMIPMKSPCIELRDVYCRALCSELRLGCPRAIPSYWREIWLRRVP